MPDPARVTLTSLLFPGGHVLRVGLARLNGTAQLAQQRPTESLDGVVLAERFEDPAAQHKLLGTASKHQEHEEECQVLNPRLLEHLPKAWPESFFSLSGKMDRNSSPTQLKFRTNVPFETS